ncbi:hypothetical protein PoB_005467200 [Plakobranchus ocellatus]|uniref:Uncharacterized protein n=1 Tax=Plakobranchus ocellatus TaxID=259542 RepID=A0AAV4C9E5_9GAST|nr:hypothetical protein PoB_005467200 [Plakobranchus ocellatus]
MTAAPPSADLNLVPCPMMTINLRSQSGAQFLGNRETQFVCLYESQLQIIFRIGMFSLSVSPFVKLPPKLGGIGGIEDSEPALRSTGTLLSTVRAPPPAS